MPTRLFFGGNLGDLFLGRDFGPMYDADLRVRQGGPVVPPTRDGESIGADAGELSLEKPGVQPRALNAVIPIAASLATVSPAIV